ncbi:MAG TPA: CBS domain-containing protein, partial [Chitinophagales bacterium]|nr:CBS domain-containing protein [Chitinophagales bacterium]
PLVIVAAISYVTVKYFEPHPMPVRQLMDKGLFAGYDSDSRAISKLDITKLIEQDFQTVQPNMNLGQLVEVVSHCSRNLFPVVDEEGAFRGIITLDDIRTLMFKPERYADTYVSQLMHAPPTVLQKQEGMDPAMKKFDETGAWNLPVLDGDKYLGIISKSRIFGVYRKLLSEESTRLEL